jgi:uncharacterized protein
MKNQATTNTLHGTAVPIQAQERYQTMDMIRGIAIMGILVMNIYAFAMPFSAYGNPYVMGGTDPLNLGTWFFTHILFDQKFLAIFSMLYGAGLIMMMERAEQREAKFGRVFYRRSFWLMVFGLLHGYFIWFGDILFGYAMSGMVIFLFRKKQARALIISGIIFLVIGSAILAMISIGMNHLRSTSEQALALQEQGQELSQEQQEDIAEWEKNRSFFAPSEQDIQAEVDAYQGSYGENMAHRVPTTMQMQLGGLPMMILWRAGGIMLIGMALMKLGIINGQRSTAFYRKMMLMGYGIGLPITIFSGYNLEQNNFDPLYSFGIGMIPNYWGSIIVALGHIGLINLLYKTGLLSRLLARFAYVGRMAFTNYLTHSIVMTAIFYGYGLGLFAEIPRFYQMGFVLGLIVIQLYLSKWWLTNFRFGPAEWLWRTLTYWKKQRFLQ